VARSALALWVGRIGKEGGECMGEKSNVLVGRKEAKGGRFWVKGKSCRVGTNFTGRINF
jgi:hypothetical protein